MKTILLTLVLFIAVAGVAADNPPATNAWSETVKGIQARLVFGEVHTFNGKRRPTVYLELHNVSDSHTPIAVDFRPDSLHFEVRSKTGKAADKPSMTFYDGVGPFCHDPLHFDLPVDATIRIPVSCFSRETGPKPGTVIQFDGEEAIWEIADDDPNDYFVTATLDKPTDKDDHNYFHWSGTLKIPAVRVPTRN